MAHFQPLVRTLTLISCAAFAHAQAPTEPARLVRLSVVALDSNGQPAAGLSAEDLQVTDQGKQQRIVLFRGAAQAGQAGESSNRPDPGARTTAILFDFLSENRAERQEAARKMGASLKQLESGESLYLYVLGPDGTLIPVHEMPKEAGAATDKAWVHDIDKVLATVIKNHDKPRPAGMSDEDVVKKTYVALETVANQLSAFPGRRDIIWITGWVQNVSNPKSTCSGDWIDCSLYVPHLSVTLDHAGVMVNPYFYGTTSVDQSRILEEMATLTGGRSYLGTDMAEVVKQFGSQALGTYNVAYEPAAANWDSKFHKVKVTCSRQGVKLVVRQRYYALPDQRPAAARQQAMMVAAYQAASDVSDIGLRAKVTPGGPNTIKVELRVDPADLLLRENAGQWSDMITVLYSARAASGPQGEPTLADMRLHLTREERETAIKEGYAITKEYPIDAATQKVRMIVLDQATDSVGSLTVPVGK